MTTTTTTGVTTAAPVTTRARVGWGDLLWVTWRQHRWMLAGTAAVAVLLGGLALYLALRVDATGSSRLELFGRWGVVGLSQLLVLAPMAFGLVVAVFWAAPLLSREYEQRTHVVVWSQDVSPLRWLTGKVVPLFALAVVLAVGLGLALIKLINSVNAESAEYVPFRPFDPPAFEVAPQVQFGFVAFGFALGLALSALTRRTVLSMGLTLGVFVVVRGLVAGGWRPYYQEPLRHVEPYATFQGVDPGGRGAWTVDSGFVDAAGNEAPYPSACSRIEDNDSYAQCMTDHDVRYFTDYHPADRLVPFQWFEFAVYAVLAAALFALAFTVVRRARRV
ncbi:ABC transporter permease [Saccharothrix sp. HUAS TT1]|uniref:ABC transporter permease n=1 Tax=unclassified Saccharothrix TaxID=2593673 RepID=UPI00345BD355